MGDDGGNDGFGPDVAGAGGGAGGPGGGNGAGNHDMSEVDIGVSGIHGTEEMSASSSVASYLGFSCASSRFDSSVSENR